QIIRNYQRQTVKVTLASPPEEPARNDTWLPNLNPFSGAKIASLSPAFALEFGLESTRAGVVVLEVRRGSSASRLGLRQGDIIRDFNGQQVRIVADMMGLKLPPYQPWSMKITRSGKELSIGRR
ncbi:MAG: PDZ domain-containing protein, partial [Planctomycetaceae bacterium]|nr:PDZ domain-containing protein [Planctomycetaceae bacterium]